jgi:ribosomal protein S8
MVEVETVSIVFTGLSISLAAFYYIMTLRNAQRTQQQQLETRQAQLFRDLLKTQEDYGFIKMFQELFYEWSFTDFNDFMAKYSNDVDARTKMTIIFGYLEGIGIMMRRGLISPDLVYEFNYNTIIGFWERYALIVEGGVRCLTHHNSMSQLSGSMVR